MELTYKFYVYNNAVKDGDGTEASLASAYSNLRNWDVNLLG